LAESVPLVENMNQRKFSILRAGIEWIKCLSLLLFVLAVVVSLLGLFAYDAGFIPGEWLKPPMIIGAVAMIYLGSVLPDVLVCRGWMARIRGLASALFSLIMISAAFGAFIVALMLLCWMIIGGCHGNPFRP
jgi:hypothetical protein